MKDLGSNAGRGVFTASLLSLLILGSFLVLALFTVLVLFVTSFLAGPQI